MCTASMPGKGAVGWYEIPSYERTGKLLLQPGHGEISICAGLVLLHTFVKNHQLLILKLILLLAQLHIQNPLQMQDYQRCDSIWGSN